MPRQRDLGESPCRALHPETHSFRCRLSQGTSSARGNGWTPPKRSLAIADTIERERTSKYREFTRPTILADGRRRLYGDLHPGFDITELARNTKKRRLAAM
jgi:hypothetical protein